MVLAGPREAFPPHQLGSEVLPSEDEVQAEVKRHLSETQTQATWTGKHKSGDTASGKFYNSEELSPRNHGIFWKELRNKEWILLTAESEALGHVTPPAPLCTLAGSGSSAPVTLRSNVARVQFQSCRKEAASLLASLTPDFLCSLPAPCFAKLSTSPRCSDVTWMYGHLGRVGVVLRVVAAFICLIIRFSK